MLAASGGLLLGTAGFARHRHRPATTVFALVLAGLVGTAVQWSFGVFLGPGPVTERAAELPTGASISMPLEVSAPAVLLVWPIAAVVGALVVAAILDDRQPWSPRLSRDGRSGRSSPQ